MARPVDRHPAVFGHFAVAFWAFPLYACVQPLPTKVFTPFGATPAKPVGIVTPSQPWVDTVRRATQRRQPKVVFEPPPLRPSAAGPLGSEGCNTGPPQGVRCDSLSLRVPASQRFACCGTQPVPAPCTVRRPPKVPLLHGGPRANPSSSQTLARRRGYQGLNLDKGRTRRTPTLRPSLPCGGGRGGPRR